MDVTQLTDAELRENLKSHGVNVGPIVESTRKVYEKKLLKLIASNNESRNDSVVSEPKGAHQNNGNGAEAQRGFSPIFRNKSPTPVIQETPADVNNEASDSDYEGEESMRYLTEEEMAADRAAARQGQKTKGGIFGSAIAFAVVFVTLAVFTYFLLENAEQFKLLIEPKSDDVI